MPTYPSVLVRTVGCLCRQTAVGSAMEHFFYCLLVADVWSWCLRLWKKLDLCARLRMITWVQTGTRTCLNASWHLSQERLPSSLIVSTLRLSDGGIYSRWHSKLPLRKRRMGPWRIAEHISTVLHDPDKISVWGVVPSSPRTYAN